MQNGKRLRYIYNESNKLNRKEEIKIKSLYEVVIPSEDPIFSVLEADKNIPKSPVFLKPRGYCLNLLRSKLEIDAEDPTVDPKELMDLVESVGKALGIQEE